MRRLLLAALVIASCDFDGAFERYCDGNPLCVQGAAGSGGSMAPGGSGGKIGDGGSGGSGGGGSGGSGGDTTEWTPPPTCQFEGCPSGLVCNFYQRVCVPACSTPEDCPESEPYCGRLSQTRSGCGCNTRADCAKEASFLVCNSLNLQCERTCETSTECKEIYGEERRFCIADPKGPAKICVGCVDSSDCPNEFPVCSINSYQCTWCSRNSDCGSRLGYQYCVRGQCVAMPP